MKNGLLNTNRWMLTLAVLPALLFSYNTQAQTSPSTDASALKRSMTGELFQNTRFEEWKEGVPVGWIIWNPEKGYSVKPGPESPEGRSTVEFVPNEGGAANLGARLTSKDCALVSGDTLVLEMDFRIDAGISMEIILNTFYGADSSGKSTNTLPLYGDGQWNTIQLTLPSLPQDWTRMDMGLYASGIKQGGVFISRISLKAHPQI